MEAKAHSFSPSPLFPRYHTPSQDPIHHIAKPKSSTVSWTGRPKSKIPKVTNFSFRKTSASNNPNIKHVFIGPKQKKNDNTSGNNRKLQGPTTTTQYPPGTRTPNSSPVREKSKPVPQTVRISRQKSPKSLDSTVNHLTQKVNQIEKSLENKMSRRKDFGVINKGVGNNKLNSLHTSVVLPPKFVQETSSSFRSSFFPTPRNSTNASTGVYRLQDSSNNRFSKSNAVKARWVQAAMEKLLASGNISKVTMRSPGFQRKIGELYDSSTDKRASSVQGYVSQLIRQSTAGMSALSIKKMSPRAPQNSRITAERSFSRSSQGKSIPLKNVTISSPRSKSFGDHPEEMQRQVSDILLNMVLKGMIAESESSVKKPGTISMPPNNGSNTVATNTEYIVNPEDEWAVFKKGKGNENVKNCFVYDGKICPLQSNVKPVSTFSPLTESRKKEDDSHPVSYFRRIADVRGFEAEEIFIRYSKNRIFVEAKHGASGDRNYRIVREIIIVPPNIKITELKIMRGRNNGRLVFEEVAEKDKHLAYSSTNK